MPYQQMQQYVLGSTWDFNPLPPAPAAAIEAPKPVIDLAARYNAQRQKRIFTGRNVPMELSA